MPTVGHNQEPAPFRVPRRGIVGWGRLAEILQFILNRMGFKVSFEGMDAHEIVGGIHLKPETGEATHPFYLSLQSDASGQLYGKIEPGTYQGEMPTLNGTALNAATAPLAALLSTGTEYIYLKVTYTLTASANGYVYSATLTECIISVQSAAQSNPYGANTTGIYWILLATVTNGRKSSQNTTTSLSGEVCDAGGEDGSATLTTAQT